MLGQKLEAVSNKVRSWASSTWFGVRIRTFLLFLSVSVIKIVALPLTSHPFDFWSFSYVVQRSFFLGWNIFEGWNKGVVLLMIWSPIYAFYSFLLQTYSSIATSDNILLLHALFKFPFFAIDTLCAVLIYKVTITITSNESVGKRASWLWFLNPLPYIVYGVHGHYELVTAFSILLILFAVTRKKTVYAIIGFVLGIQVKYFIIILLPFYLLLESGGRFTRTSVSRLLRISIAIFLGLAISFIPYLAQPDLRMQLFASVLKLSKVNISSLAENSVIRVPATNIFSSAYYFISGEALTNQVGLFGIASSGLIISAVLLCILFLYRLYCVFVRSKPYDLGTFAVDWIRSLVLFVISLSNFQAHYFVWFVPLLVLFAVTNSGRIHGLFSIYTMVCAVYYLRGESGTEIYFSDLLTGIDIISFASKYVDFVYLEGTLIIFCLISIAVSARKPRETRELEGRFGRNAIAFSYVFTWLMILSVFLQASYILVQKDVLPERMTVDRVRGITKGMVYAVHNSMPKEADRIMFESYSRTRSLVLSALVEGGSRFRARSNVYVLDQSFDSAQNRRSAEGEALFLNSCKIQSETKQVVFPLNGKNVFGKRVDVECLKESNVLTGSGLDKMTDPVLYMVIAPETYLFNCKNWVQIFLGGIQLIGWLYLSIKCIGILSYKRSEL